MVFHWSLSDSKCPQVSRTLLSILAVLSSAVDWMVCTHLPTSKSSSPFNNPLVTVPKAPITIHTIVTLMFHKVSINCLPLVKGDQKAPFSIATTPRCKGRALLLSQNCSTLPSIHTLYCRVLSKEVSSTIFKVFGMTRPGIEPRSPGSLTNTLPTRPMSREVLILLFIFFQFYSVVSQASKVNNFANSFFFFLLLIIIRSGLLAEIRWSVCTSKSHWSLCVSFSRTAAGLCIYHLFVWSNLNFLHIF